MASKAGAYPVAEIIIRILRQNLHKRFANFMVWHTTKLAKRCSNCFKNQLINYC